MKSLIPLFAILFLILASPAEGNPVTLDPYCTIHSLDTIPINETTSVVKMDYSCTAPVRIFLQKKGQPWPSRDIEITDDAISHRKLEYTSSLYEVQTTYIKIVGLWEEVEIHEP